MLTLQVAKCLVVGRRRWRPDWAAGSRRENRELRVVVREYLLKCRGTYLDCAFVEMSVLAATSSALRRFKEPLLVSRPPRRDFLSSSLLQYG